MFRFIDPQKGEILLDAAVIAAALAAGAAQFLPAGALGTTLIKTGIVADSGGIQAGATPLPAAINVVSTVGGSGYSVALPPITPNVGVLGSVGSIIFVSNSAATNAMQVFGGGVDDTINGADDQTGVAVAAGVNVWFAATSYDPVAKAGTWLMTNSQAAAVAAITSGSIAGVTIDNSVVGGTTPAAGTFTDLKAAQIEGTDSSLDIVGLSAAQGGTVVSRGGPSSTSANAGGPNSLIGGTPGVTGVGGPAHVKGGPGGATSGKGGTADVIGGDAVGTGASGGAVLLQGGAKNGSGLDGPVINRGTYQGFKQATPTAKTTDATLTAAEVLSGLITANEGGAATATYTFPLGTDLDAALPTDFTTGDSFMLRAVNISTVAAEIATFVGNTGTTLKGSGAMLANDAAANKSSAAFLIRKTGSGTFDIFRV